MATEHDFEAELTREAREQAERDHADTCEFGWHDRSENKGHICRLPKGHPLPHRCGLNKTCQAKYDA